MSVMPQPYSFCSSARVYVCLHGVAIAGTGTRASVVVCVAAVARCAPPTVHASLVPSPQTAAHLTVPLVFTRAQNTSVNTYYNKIQ